MTYDHRITLDLSSSQHAQLKRMALDDGRTMADVLRKLVDLYIKAVNDKGSE